MEERQQQHREREATHGLAWHSMERNGARTCANGQGRYNNVNANANACLLAYLLKKEAKKRETRMLRSHNDSISKSPFDQEGVLETTHPNTHGKHEGGNGCDCNCNGIWSCVTRRRRREQIAINKHPDVAEEATCRW
jgi:hypothetical protein